MSRNNAKWGVLGVIVGAIAGLLFAPKSGKETREDLKQGAVKAKEQAAQKAAALKREVTGRVDDVSGATEKYADKASRAAKKGVEAAKEELNK